MKLLKLLLFALTITLGWVCNSATQEDYHEFDRFFHSLENFNGNVLIAIDGKSIYSNSFGYASKELSVKNSRETKFRIGSISKPITAIAIMILVEKGLINENDRLSTYIPDLPASWKEITIHQLLTHTSGLAYQSDDLNTLTELTIGEVFEIYQNLPLLREPGTSMNYSNIGYFALSVLIEEVTSMSYDGFIKREIFEKLGMVNSGVDYPNQILLHRADGYEVNADGIVENAVFDNMLMKRGAGSMYSTVDDLLKFDRALSTNLLLKEETLDKMSTPFTTDKDMGVDVKYGYGLDIVKNDSISMIFHTGGVLGFQSMFYKFPEKGIVIIACANITNLYGDWRTDFYKLVYNKLSGTE